MSNNETIMDFKNMSDKEVLAAYYKFINPKSLSVIGAGFCAGELLANRGYTIDESGDTDKFIKKAKKEVKAA